MSVGCVTTEYLVASFKGVMFEVKTAESEHGRRGAVGEFPFGEDTAYADLGRKSRTYTLSARFAENSHLADVEALIAAVESPGSGTLVHPTRGIVQAACRSMKVKDELIEEQGVSYADLEFVEANDWAGGMSFAGTILGVSIAPIIAAAESVFLRDYAPTRVPYHRRPEVRDVARTEIGVVRSEYSKANPGSTDNSVLRALADYDTIMSDDSLLDKPDIVRTAISGGMAATNRSIAGNDKFDAMRRIANSAAQGSTLNGVAGTSQEAVYTLTRTVAGAYLSQSALEQRFTNVDEALRYLDAATTVLTGEAELAYTRCDNDLFIELRRYIVAFRAQIYAKAYTLPGIVSYDFLHGVHPLTAAYHIYGDAKRHRELELGNLISSSGRFDNPVVGAG